MQVIRIFSGFPHANLAPANTSEALFPCWGLGFSLLTLALNENGFCVIFFPLKIHGWERLNALQMDSNDHVFF